MAQTQTDSERKRLQRERTRKHREKVKEQAAIAAAADEERRFEEFNEHRRAERLVMPGEREAFINAESVEDALQVAREFLAALNQPDIQCGESLLSVERRVMTAWIKIGAPLLNRNTLSFDEETGSTIDGFTFDFDKRWIPIEGSDAPIDVALPVIEIPAAAPAPLPPPVPAVTWDDPAFKNYRTDEVAELCKAQQDRCDADARRISARNEKRETEREKRLGVSYAYAHAE
jgi:hypothetical protein